MVDFSVGIGDDTIAAIITPPGEGGIAAIRLAGKKSLALLRKHFRPHATGAPTPFLMRLGLLVAPDGAVIDEVMAVYMPAGHSYTNLDQVEIFCHGGRLVVRQILKLFLDSGARAAEPGEFTKLAFLAGRIDLSRAEAVAEIISANTALSHRTATEHLLGAYSEFIDRLREQMVDILADIEASVDFPEEDLEPEAREHVIGSIRAVSTTVEQLAATYSGGRLLREGFKVAISGRPNAGKSSLFNLLLRRQRALVTATAGTTRDYLSEWIDMEGLAVNIVDTAGLRATGGRLEQAGQHSARQIVKTADLILWLVDVSQKNWKSLILRDVAEFKSHPLMVVGNKIDLVGSARERELATKAGGHPVCYTSCRTGRGIKHLKERLTAHINENLPDLTSGLIVTSSRHQQKLKKTKQLLHTALRQFRLGESPEIVAFSLRQAVNQIDEITGKVYNEEILGRIFSKFCVGK